MAKRNITKGSTDVSIEVFIPDSSSTVGEGLTGLVYNSAGLSCYYHRPGSVATALTLATQTVAGTHVDGGFVEIDSTNMKGHYRLDLSDAIIASGVDSVTLHLRGAANMAPVPVELQLISADFNDSVRLGLTSLPNAAVESAGGLYTRGTGAGQINQSANGQVDVNIERLNNIAQSLLDLKDFADAGYDPVTNKVEGVKLVDTTTTNTDMRGTDNAALASVATEARLSELDAINLPTDIANVKSDTSSILTDTGTTGVVVATNNDKTGYSILGIKTTLDALNDISTAQVNAEVDTALADYDAPTNTEMVAAFTEIKGATWSGITDTLEEIRNKGTDIETDTQNIQSRLPTALVSGKLDSSVEAYGTNLAPNYLVWKDTLITYTDGEAGKRLKGITAIPVVEGLVVGTNSTTVFTTNLTGYGDSHFDDELVIIETGVGTNIWQSRPVGSYVSATGEMTVYEPLTFAPVANARIVVQADHIHPINQVQAGLATEAKQDIIDANVDALITSIAALNNVSVADILTTPMTESYSATPTTEKTVAQALYELVAILVNRNNTGTTSVFRKLDGTTTAFTATLDDATTPSDVKRAT